MKVKKSAQAGSLESQDILITVDKGKKGSGIIIDLESPSIVQYGRKIRSEIESVISDMGITDVLIKAIDKGALGFTIKARTEAALIRACKEKEEY
ncbi:MAG: citrate lyase acyl carrier protein [Asgard group archaeon]|nr:citrate lyase acyl carrier protein [Asgard group archaeon]